MNEKQVAKELVKIAKHLVGLVGRRSDNTGKPIRPVEHYILVLKSGGNRGKYFMDGSLTSPDLTDDISRAFEFSGGRLLDMGYDWTLSWNAIGSRFLQRRFV